MTGKWAPLLDKLEEYRNDWKVNGTESSDYLALP